MRMGKILELISGGRLLGTWEYTNTTVIVVVMHHRNKQIQSSIRDTGAYCWVSGLGMKGKLLLGVRD